ncbi:MAG: V-type ATPase subunit [Bacillota bacterium]
MASKIFANTSAAAKSVNLLNQEKLSRLLDGNTGEDGLKVLAELSYGDTSIENPYDFEILIESEMEKHFEFIKEASPDAKATACFFAELDFHNLKCALKTKYGKIKEYEALSYSFASVESGALLDSVLNDEYRSLSRGMKNACEEADAAHIAGSLSPSKIDYICDKYMFADIFENLKGISSKTLKDYFTAKVDLINVQTLLRAKLHEIDAAALKNMLFEGGKFNVQTLINQFDSSYDSIVDFYMYSSYNEVVKILVGEIADGSSQVEFEKQRDKHLLNLFKDKKFAAQDADLFYGYIVAKQFEFDNIRLIMVGLNNKLDKNKIKVRLKELYV